MSEEEVSGDIPAGPLRRGWTTGACATAATRAAYEALVTGTCPDPVEIELPSGTRVAFAIATFERNAESATAGIVKDAGDDPDVTHGALVLATVRPGAPGSGVTFRAGEGVGTVTRAGLPIPPGEPAINPVPRRMIRDAIDGSGSRGKSRRVAPFWCSAGGLGWCVSVFYWPRNITSYAFEPIQ